MLMIFFMMTMTMTGDESDYEYDMAFDSDHGNEFMNNKLTK